MKKIVSTLFFCFFLFSAFSQANRITLVTGAEGDKLMVDDRPFMVNGMNWDYFPIGTNYEYILWSQSDAFIKAALKTEMSALKKMGVNAIRQYTGVPARWIQYIYEEYGIFTMLNHSFGRYGLEVDGTWMANTDYANPKVREILLGEVQALAREYSNTPGLLLYLLGNENNYGLFWEGAETEDIPEDDPQIAIRARAMYQLFNEGVRTIKEVDASHPVAICNGDLLYLDIIAEECPDADIFGANVYRGLSFGDFFQRVQAEYGKPILFTEFGADAFNVISQSEDQEAQAYFNLGNWQEVYENAAGLGKTGNSLGGFTFQFTDGWWKFGQTKNLDLHDTNASWANGGYDRDYTAGANNMNEEWFGVCAKGANNDEGLYPLYPRAAYYALQQAHQLNPYTAGMNTKKIQQHFNKISLRKAKRKAQRVIKK
jgi:hypothetical protein